MAATAAVYGLVLDRRRRAGRCAKPLDRLYLATPAVSTAHAAARSAAAAARSSATAAVPTATPGPRMTASVAAAATSIAAEPASSAATYAVPAVAPAPRAADVSAPSAASTASACNTPAVLAAAPAPRTVASVVPIPPSSAEAKDGKLHQPVLGQVRVSGQLVQGRDNEKVLGQEWRRECAPSQLVEDVDDACRKRRGNRVAVVLLAVRVDGCTFTHQ